MEFALDWKLVYRSEEDMNRLFKTSKLARRYTKIRYEQGQTNLFACCTRRD